MADASTQDKQRHHALLSANPRLTVDEQKSSPVAERQGNGENFKKNSKILKIHGCRVSHYLKVDEPITITSDLVQPFAHGLFGLATNPLIKSYS